MLSNLALDSHVLPLANGGPDLFARLDHTTSSQSVADRLLRGDADLLVADYQGNLAKIESAQRPHRACFVRGAMKAEMFLSIQMINGVLHTVAHEGNKACLPLTANEIVVERLCPNLVGLAKKLAAHMKVAGGSFAIGASPWFEGQFVVIFTFSGRVPDDDVLLNQLQELLAA